MDKEGRSSRTSFNQSCVKIPVNPITGMPSPGYERHIVMGPTSLPNRASCRASRASSASGPRSRASSAQQQRPSSSSRKRDLNNKQEDTPAVSLGPLLSFYESIPDYSELGHLSDREFYAKVRELRETQRAHVSQLTNVQQQPCQDPQRWTAGVQGVRCVLNESRGVTPVPCSPSSSARSGTRNLQAWGRGLVGSPLVSPVPARRRPGSKSKTLVQQERPRIASGSSIVARVDSARRSRVSSIWDDDDESWEDALMVFSEDEVTEESRGGHQQQTSRIHKNVAWREPQFTVPKPFQMTRREEEERYYELLRRELLRDHNGSRGSATARTPSPPRRSHEVPLTSRLPLFHGILLQQELRREREKRRSKAKLLSQVRPFSFDLDNESPTMRLSRTRTKMWRSSPELRDLSRIRGGGEFRAKPMPRHLYDAEAHMRHHEEKYLRQLHRRVRAEETLRNSSLPPSMATRSFLSHTPCIPVTSLSPQHEPRRQMSAPVSKSSESRRSLGVSPDCRTGGCSPYEVAFFEEPRRRRPNSGSVSPIRHNLAAVLRIENCRRRAEREAALRMEQRRSMEEARTRARVLRRRPAWRHMQQMNARHDLAMRTAARREEEQSRQQEHARFMGRMMGRVLGIPTLFERQAMQSVRLRTHLNVETTPQKQQEQCPIPERKFIPPPVETHISFCPGTRNNRRSSSTDSGNEKRDEPEFTEKRDSEEEKKHENREVDTLCTEPVSGIAPLSK